MSSTGYRAGLHGFDGLPPSSPDAVASWCRTGLSKKLAGLTYQMLAREESRKKITITDLAQSPSLGVQVGCTLNVHDATVTTAHLFWARTFRLSLQMKSMVGSVQKFGAHNSANSVPRTQPSRR